MTKILSVLDSTYTGDTPYRVWFHLDNSLIQRNRPILKFNNCNLFEIIANFRMKINFFPRQAMTKILFVLDSRYKCDTPYRVWFDLDNSLIR